MAVKPIRPGVKVEPRKTPEAVQAVIDRLQAAAEAGVMTSVAVAWVCDDGCDYDFSADPDDSTSLTAVTHQLDFQVTHDSIFSEE